MVVIRKKRMDCKAVAERSGHLRGADMPGDEKVQPVLRGQDRTGCWIMLAKEMGFVWVNNKFLHYPCWSCLIMGFNRVSFRFAPLSIWMNYNIGNYLSI